jgi:hypothetical protein
MESGLYRYGRSPHDHSIVSPIFILVGDRPGGHKLFRFANPPNWLRYSKSKDLLAVWSAWPVPVLVDGRRLRYFRVEVKAGQQSTARLTLVCPRGRT